MILVHTKNINALTVWLIISLHPSNGHNSRRNTPEATDYYPSNSNLPPPSGETTYGIYPPYNSYADPTITSSYSDEDCLDYSDSTTATIIPLALSLSNIAQSTGDTSDTENQWSNNCTDQNGGCINFVQSLESCQDDNCACTLSYPAQICAQCLSLEKAVQEYNLYLTACNLRALIRPTETITAECQDATDTSDVLTDMLASQLATATATTTGTGKISTGSDGSINGDGIGNVAVQMPDGSEVYDTAELSGQEGYISTFTTTNSVGQPTSVITFVGPTSVPSSAQTGSPYSPVSPNEQTSNTAALDSTHTFFSESVDSTCEQDCEYWLKLAQTCTSDSCICTPDAQTSAQACSSCVLSANSNQRMNAYAGFTQGCITASTMSTPDDPTEATTTDVNGNAAYAIPSDSTQSSGNSNPFEEETGGQSSSTGKAVKTKVAEQAKGMATTVEVEEGQEGSATRRCGKLFGIGGVGWLSTGIAGGVLMVYMT